MVRKLEFADPVYYCRVLRELIYAHILPTDTDTACVESPNPDCRRCIVRLENLEFIKEM